MRFCADAHFALIDGDEGGAILLTDYRRLLAFDAADARLESVQAVFAAIDAVTTAGEWVVLAVDYGLGELFEPLATTPGHDRKRLRAWVFGCCERLDAASVKASLGECLSSMTEQQRWAGVAELHATLSEITYAPKVEQVRRWITDGDCYQVNLTFPLDFRVYGHPLALYAGLRERQPVHYGAFVAVPESTLLSLSPELFFERQGVRVFTRPMKGTAPRGATPEEDAALCAAMLASDKERAENVMIVDLLRNDLGRLAAPGKVQVDVLCEAEPYPTLWQQVSTVSAELPGVPLFDLFRSLFPCGSITGAPKIRAMQRIAELEGAARNLYTGALGWVAPGGDCRFNVAIRTFELDPHGNARLGIGGGIVIDADPAREYAECLLKARFLTGFDPGFELIETMRLESGHYPLWGLHLERLRHSARVLGFTLNMKAIEAVLAEQASSRSAGVFRVRLSLGHGGGFKVTVSELDEPAHKWQIVLANEILPEGEYLRAHKTSARGRYDAVLAGLPEGVFDAIFLNTRGEVCEGARSNVFVLRDGIWLTPPLSSGVLPGVMRRALIESGQAVEHVLYLKDLQTATEICVVNALRGLIPVLFMSESVL